MMVKGGSAKPIIPLALLRLAPAPQKPY